VLSSTDRMDDLDVKAAFKAASLLLESASVVSA
jgi:hypothetical protein